MCDCESNISVFYQLLQINGGFDAKREEASWLIIYTTQERVHNRYTSMATKWQDYPEGRCYTFITINHLLDVSPC